MTRPLSILLVLWSLVATPVLCRVGVRLGCCAAPQGIAASVTDDHDDDCADRECPPARAPAEPGTSQPTPCEGSPCAGVCSPVAKPLDHASNVDLTPAAGPAVAWLATIDERPSLWRPSVPDEPPTEVALPFPHSDIPLLI